MRKSKMNNHLMGHTKRIFKRYATELPRPISLCKTIIWLNGESVALIVKWRHRPRIDGCVKCVPEGGKDCERMIRLIQSRGRRRKEEII